MDIVDRIILENQMLIMENLAKAYDATLADQKKLNDQIERTKTIIRCTV